MTDRVPDEELPDFDLMDPRYVRRELRAVAADVREDLECTWGERSTRERTVDVSGYAFPETPEVLFPWAAVALVVDGSGERVLLLRHDDHQYAWEPPGGKGEYGESPAETAVREVREETGVEATVTNLLLVETLQFDYGTDVTAPVIQAVFAGRTTGVGDPVGREAAIPVARWFSRDELPADAQFRELIVDLLE